MLTMLGLKLYGNCREHLKSVRAYCLHYELIEERLVGMHKHTRLANSTKRVNCNSYCHLYTYKRQPSTVASNYYIVFLGRE